VPVPSTFDHLPGEINPYTVNGLKAGQQVATATSHFQNTLTGSNEVTIHAQQPAMVSPTPTVPSVHLDGSRIPKPPPSVRVGQRVAGNVG